MLKICSTWINACTGHACSWTVTTFQTSWGGCEWFERHKSALMKRLFILNSIWCHHKKKSKGLRLAVSGSCTSKSKCLGKYIDKKIFWWGTHSWSLSKNSRYTVYDIIGKWWRGWLRVRHSNELFKHANENFGSVLDILNWLSNKMNSSSRTRLVWVGVM